MIEGIIGALGVVAVLYCVCVGDISAEEEEKRREMADRYEASLDKRRRRCEDTCDQYRRGVQRAYDQQDEELRAERQRLLQKKQAENAENYQMFSENLRHQRENKEKLLEDCGEILKYYAKSFEEQQKSYARANTLKSSILTAQEAENKLRAYLHYLEQYEKKLVDTYTHTGELYEPFSMTLPEGTPYAGQLILLEKNQFTLSKDNYIYKTPQGESYKLDKNKNDFFQKQGGGEPLPFVYRSEKAPYQAQLKLSLARGYLREAINKNTKVDVDVEKVNFSHKLLTVGGCKFPSLFLHNKNLLNSNMKTPIGSKLQLYVTDYDFSLSGRPNRIQMSEKLAHVRVLESFDEVILLASRENRQLLRNYLVENDLLSREGEWRIAPIYTGNALTGLIFQIEQIYGYTTRIDSTGSNSAQFFFEQMLPVEELVDFDQVFVATDVRVCCMVEDRFTEDEFRELSQENAKLLLYLSHEFTDQKFKLSATPLHNYLSQWTKITNRLIEACSVERSFDLVVNQFDYVEHGGKTQTRFLLEPEPRLYHYLNEQKDGYRPRFFLLNEGDDGPHKIFCTLEIKEDGQLVLFAKWELDSQYLMKVNFALTLNVLGNTSAEQKQEEALQDFRSGKVVSDQVVNSILSPKVTGFHDSNLRLNTVYNRGLLQNEAQLSAVIKAMASRDTYWIQGPPGTGKTTVIKEIILQQLSAQKLSKILVVSQANVAVDNVLLGLLEICPKSDLISEDQLIRCGNEGKIDANLKHLTLNAKFSHYKQRLKTEKTNSKAVTELREKWLKIMDNADHEHLVTEFFLNSFQIVGATCVGLTNQKQGFSHVEFDLVLIDEAAKALAGEILIPVNRAKKVIFIGDHKQLPPVISEKLHQGGAVDYQDVVAEEEQYDFMEQSFFQRMYEDAPDNMKSMLTIQFRMPPPIAQLVNLFYEDQLQTGPSCFEKTPLFLNQHLIFIDMKDEAAYKEEKQDKSNKTVQNLKEVEVVNQLIEKIRSKYQGCIVVITPYNGQKRLIEKKISQGIGGIGEIVVNTIDAFQGDEEEVVIYCTTRAKVKTNYFSDSARLNVAFSRAKNTLFFLASSSYLESYGTEHILHQVLERLRANSHIVPYHNLESLDFSADFTKRKKSLFSLSLTLLKKKEKRKKKKEESYHWS